MLFDSPVEKHYTRKDLYNTIINKLQELGITAATRKDIAGVDEFHVRGATVSIELAKEAGFNKKTKVLDIGCGLGGPCRMIADEYGCDVTGIDITEEFIQTARRLTALVKLDDKVNFLKADALQLPFDDESFDITWTQHVQMNIEDKHTFYAEMNRVLKPGGKFIYYDVFSKNKEPLHYPVPWADEASISFLITVNELDELLQGLGLNKIQTKDQTPAGVEFFEILSDKMAKGEVPTIGLPMLIGVTSKQKFENLYRNFKEGKLEIQSDLSKKLNNVSCVYKLKLLKAICFYLFWLLPKQYFKSYNA